MNRKKGFWKFLSPLMNQRGAVGDDDLEFATAEDLKAINENPALQKIYNAMKAGVTKKFQGWAGERKQLADTLTSYEGILGQWEEWRPVLDSYVADGARGDVDDDDDRDRGDGGRGRTRGKVKGRDDGGALDSLKTFRDEVTQAAQGFTKELSTMRRMLDLSLQLDDLRRDHFEHYPDVKFDVQKVLGTALDKGYQDLGDAYASVYREDFIKKDVDKQVTTRLAEADAARKVPGETGSGAMPVHFKLPDETPKTFSDASKGVLEEIKAGTLTAEKK